MYLLSRAWYVGVHLGLLQTGYLLSLQRAISAAHETYAAVVGSWLLGSLLGLWLRVEPRLCMALGLASYLLVQWVLMGVDFVAYRWPWWAPAIVVSGVYSGRFFTGAIEAGAQVGPTFARETYGFLFGAVLALVSAVVYGREALLLVPLVSGAICMFRNGNKQNS